MRLSVVQVEEPFLSVLKDPLVEDRILDGDRNHNPRLEIKHGKCSLVVRCCRLKDGCRRNKGTPVRPRESQRNDSKPVGVRRDVVSGLRDSRGLIVE